MNSLLSNDRKSASLVSHKSHQVIDQKSVHSVDDEPESLFPFDFEMFDDLSLSPSPPPVSPEYFGEEECWSNMSVSQSTRYLGRASVNMSVDTFDLKWDDDEESTSSDSDSVPMFFAGYPMHGAMAHFQQQTEHHAYFKVPPVSSVSTDSTQ